MKYAPNQRMPWCRYFWAAHTHRVMRLTLEQRGMLDAIRCELSSVLGVKMLRLDLMARLHIKPGSKGERLLDGLIAACLLDQDAEGWVSDEVLTSEWAWALDKSEKARISASKPRKQPQRTPEDSLQVPAGDAQDF